MLGGYGGAVEIHAHPLDVPARQGRQPPPTFQIDRAFRLQSGLLQPRAMERHGAPAMGHQPAERMDLVFEKPLVRPPLAVLKPLLVAEDVGPRKR